MRGFLYEIIKLCCSSYSDNKNIDDETAAPARSYTCVSELKAWTTHRRLQLNDSDTKVLVITTPSSASKQSLVI